MALPNFLIIGASKSGTTSVYHYLKQHPAIFMSPNKEPQFFSLGTIPLNETERKRKVRRVLSERDYRRLFAGVRNEKAIGEASTSYLDNPGAPGRIKALLPNAKLVAILRNPADRAHSHFVFNKKRFLEDIPTFTQALQAEPGRIDDPLNYRFKYLGKGDYFRQLQGYLRHFSAERIKVYLYEDLQRAPYEMLKDMFTFLEVDESFKPDISIRYNVSGTYRNPALASLLKTFYPLNRFLQNNLPPRFVSMVGKKVMQPQKLDAEIRQQLVIHFREDVLKLQDLLRRDLSNWLR